VRERAAGEAQAHDALRALAHALGGVRADDLAAREEHEPRARAIDLAEVVRRQQDRRARARVFGEQLEQRAALGRIESLGRLVEDAHGHARCERRGERELALHAVAVRAHARGERQVQRARDLACAGARLGLAAAQEPVEMLLGAHLAVQRDLARRVRRAPTHGEPVARECRAADAGLARVRPHDADQHAQERALAAAVGAEQAGDLARARVEVDSGDGDDGPEAAREPARLDPGSGRAR
jgi:hypothetical protein